uniref:L1 transposable element n=1 Tax=Pyxicephalus adspersus TaxID=30357 RepID=A0A499QJW8_PYXAD|nr:L1 transposable element [Pyxicephalus adspersus]
MKERIIWKAWQRGPNKTNEPHPTQTALFLTSPPSRLDHPGLTRIVILKAVSRPDFCYYPRLSPKLIAMMVQTKTEALCISMALMTLATRLPLEQETDLNQRHGLDVEQIPVY